MNTELRYLKRVVKLADGLGINDDVWERVLQYRTWRTDIVAHPEIGYISGWGEWKDVETVTEES